jgi:hypothetical protein
VFGNANRGDVTIDVAQCAPNIFTRTAMSPPKALPVGIRLSLALWLYVVYDMSKWMLKKSGFIFVAVRTEVDDPSITCPCG